MQKEWTENQYPFCSFANEQNWEIQSNWTGYSLYTCWKTLWLTTENWRERKISKNRDPELRALWLWIIYTNLACSFHPCSPRSSPHLILLFEKVMQEHPKFDWARRDKTADTCLGAALVPAQPCNAEYNNKKVRILSPTRKGTVPFNSRMIWFVRLILALSFFSFFILSSSFLSLSLLLPWILKFLKLGHCRQSIRFSHLHLAKRVQ